MSNLSMEKDIPSKPNRQSDAQAEQVQSREWKPTVRLNKREETPRQKLRLKDLSPDKQYVKEVIDNELRYFLLLVIPVVITAIFSAMQREDLYNRLVSFLVGFFQ